MQLEDWLDDLCVRFIINLPPEELGSVERICFQIEEAQWFYEDFIRPLDPSLPSLALRPFYLRITQRCPLFREWSADHHAKAFEQFLAYKQRVPVRGAIMLNQSMDEVLLVKGWKKGANWSFPRGKINKDENDIDCAIREAYEETGFDIRAAGLVKSERKMKYIEITMREQHMRLYVFRGVPKDTHFAPRTRKEISKIEWYKLGELPTLKRKQQHQEGTGEHLALNANKFYMVAPFVQPLKKWIAQEKKREGRYVSSLTAPPILAEETATEDERGAVVPSIQEPYPTSPPVPSSLPEVSYQQDPLAGLKAQLNMPGARPPLHVANSDPTRSNALLSLLRNGSTAEMRASPQTPMDQVSFAPEVPRSPERHIHQYSHPNILQSPPPPFQVAHHRPMDQHHYPPIHGFNQHFPHPDNYAPQHLDNRQMVAPYQRTGEHQFFTSPERARDTAVPSADALPMLTNHTKTLLDAFRTDRSPPPPDNPAQLSAAQHNLLAAFSARVSPQQPSRSSSIQPSSNQLEAVSSDNQPQLAKSPRPPLNHPQPTHASGLLELLQKPNMGSPSPAPPTTAIPATQSEQQKQGIELLKLLGQKPRVQAATQTNAVEAPVNETVSVPQAPVNPLLELLRRPAQSSPAASTVSLVQAPPSNEQNVLEMPATAPVELSGLPAERDKSKKSNKNDLLGLLSSKKVVKHSDPDALKPGHTGATLTAPLNQPQFDVIPKSHTSNDEELKRSPVAAHRKLFDPKYATGKQSTPIKVLSKPEEKPKHLKSPRPAKAQPVKSPKRQPVAKESTKLFQPQILKRPQAADTVDVDRFTPSPGTVIPTTSPLNQNLASITSAGLVQSPFSDTSTQAKIDSIGTTLPLNTRNPSQHSDNHKADLLSLLKSPTPASTIAPNPSSEPTPKLSTTSIGPIFNHPFSGAVSPLMGSQVFSPIHDNTMESLNIRSRVSSLASNTSGAVSSSTMPAPTTAPAPTSNSRPSVSKRQTAEGDKAFLMNYLGRMASQEAK